MAAADPKNYDYGSRVRHTLRVETNDLPDDPTTVTVYLADPLNNVTGPYGVTKNAAGQYEYQRTYTAAVPSTAFGSWEITWRGTGNAEGGKKRPFIINSV